MANTIKVTYKVNEDGSLERISKKAEKAAKSTDKVTQSKNRYNKVEKGTAQLTSNSTKAFSKQMNQPFYYYLLEIYRIRKPYGLLF